MEDGLVLRDRLSFYEVVGNDGLDRVYIRGRLHCRHNVAIKVDKCLAVRRNSRGHDDVKGTDYSYHGWFQGTKVWILRYDSAYGIDDLHKHVFDPGTGQELAIEPVSYDELPTLTEFVTNALSIAQSVIASEHG